MTPICGVVGVDGRPVGARDLAGVMDALRPLGPAEASAWSGRAGRVTVALGASQPARSADGALCVVADATLDCRADLTARLGGTTGPTDAELILAAYERWGERCLDALSGAFAFAVADARRGGVLVARDQLGVRPLSVHHGRGLVAFATTALSLCSLDAVGHELDHERVGEWLALLGDTERTFVAGVETLPAGHCEWIAEHGPRRRRYWSVEPDRFVERASAEAYASELRAALDDAVERRLPSAGLGVLLSGGLDSTAVAATAARLRPDLPIRTYTAVPSPGWSGPTAPGFDADESPVVRAVASMHANLDPRFVGGGTAPMLAAHDASFAAGSPPPRNPCNELWLREAQRLAGSDGVSTLLTGARGNAFFSADDPFWVAALLARGRFGFAARELRASVAHGVAPRELALHLLPPVGRRMLRGARSRLTGGAVRDDLHFAGPPLADVVLRHASVSDPPTRRSLRLRLLRAAEWSGYAAEVALVRDTLAGVRTLDPTGDVRLVSVCATQPPWARRSGGRTRVVARDALADRLPVSVTERTRRGAQLPDWLEHVTARRGELVRELEAAREHALSRELLDLDAVDRALRDWPDPARLRAQFDRTTWTYRFDLPRALLMSRYLRFFGARAQAARRSRLASSASATA